MKFKTIDKLDKLSRKQLITYRRSLLGRDDYNTNGSKEYLEELELYDMLRFKDEYFAMYDRWALNANFDHLAKFMKSIVDEPEGKESLYQLSLNDLRNKHKLHSTNILPL